MDPARYQQLEALVRSLNGATKNVSLYPLSHPASAKFQTSIVQVLESLLEDRETTQVGLAADDLVVVEGAPWMGPAEQAATLQERMRRRNIGTVTFLRGITPSEVRILLEVLSMEPPALAARGGAPRALGEKGARHVMATAMKPREEKAPPAALDQRQAVAVYNNAVGVVRSLMLQVRMGHVPQAAEVHQVVQGLTDVLFRDTYTVVGLTMLKSYDEYLFNHSVNVGILAMALAHTLGLEGEVLREVGFGAFLHDIGKVNWPESLYRKPRDLTREEWEVVRRHPSDGVKIVERMGGSGTARSIVLEHHMRFDGSPQGYPALPLGKEASSFGRLAAVADGYDAMTTHRPYQGALEPTRAIANLQAGSGTRYEPKVVEAFLKLMGAYPVGTLVRLNTRELAVVLKPQEDPGRPLVRLVAGADGTLVSGGSEIDLTEKNPVTKEYARSIVLAVDPGIKNIDVARFLQPGSETLPRSPLPPTAS